MVKVRWYAYYKRSVGLLAAWISGTECSQRAWPTPLHQRWFRNIAWHQTRHRLRLGIVGPTGYLMYCGPQWIRLGGMGPACSVNKLIKPVVISLSVEFRVDWLSYVSISQHIGFTPGQQIGPGLCKVDACHRFHLGPTTLTNVREV